MSAADQGVSLPTLLGRRAAAWGVLSFCCLIGGALGCFVPSAFVVGVGLLCLGLALGLWAVRLLANAFRMRRRLIVERHIRELTELLGEPPSVAIVVRETGCHERDAQALLALQALQASANSATGLLSASTQRD